MSLRKFGALMTFVCGAVLGGAVARSFHDPNIIVPAYGIVTTNRVGKMLYFDPEQGAIRRKGRFPLTPLAQVTRGTSSKNRVAVLGTVTAVAVSHDGDTHVNVSEQGITLITEITPESPLPIPEKGRRIKIWGTTRYDVAHAWWEIHPVVGWEYTDALSTP